MISSPSSDGSRAGRRSSLFISNKRSCLRSDIMYFLEFWILIRIEKMSFHNRRNLLLAINQINPRARHNYAKVARARMPKKLTFHSVGWPLGLAVRPSFALFLMGFICC